MSNRCKTKIIKTEWPSGIQRCSRCTDGCGFEPQLDLHQCLWTCLQVCRSKRLGCHANFYTVSRCCTGGESEDHRGKKTRKNESTLALKPTVDVARNKKQGYQWPHKKRLISSKFFFWKINVYAHFVNFRDVVKFWQSYPNPLQTTLGDSIRKTHKYHRASKLMKPCRNRKDIFVLLLLKCVKFLSPNKSWCTHSYNITYKNPLFVKRWRLINGIELAKASSSHCIHIILYAQDGFRKLKIRQSENEQTTSTQGKALTWGIGDHLWSNSCALL